MEFSPFPLVLCFVSTAGLPISLMIKWHFIFQIIYAQIEWRLVIVAARWHVAFKGPTEYALLSEKLKLIILIDDLLRKHPYILQWFSSSLWMTIYTGSKRLGTEFTFEPSWASVSLRHNAHYRKKVSQLRDMGLERFMWSDRSDV